ncbi:MAG: TonB-dependent receptor [Bacteroidales bacterium]|nr:TonB-dependent receptor [Bacteroidales bacterium]
MKKSLLILVLSVFATCVAWAQITTSALGGKISDENGEVFGATVQAIHTPSGTHYGAISNEHGAFSIQGMRVGGPYTIKVSYVGYAPQVYEEVYLQLGETFKLNVRLNVDAEMLNDVVVVGQGSKFATTLKTGASTNISNDQMLALPTVSRDITDMVRLSPYGGNGMKFGGSDGRTANFTVDGANFNNNFGLSDKLPGGGNPISIEAIQEMQVVISPFDVRQTGFIGGGVNAITKSGTNTFKGSAYIFHQNENMRGDAIEREQLEGVRAKDQKTTYGFTLGGPIIKDKLFFFGSLEFQKIPTIANRWRASESATQVAGQMNAGTGDADNYLSRTSAYDMQQVSDYVKSKYGYNTGSYTSFPADEDNRKILFRLDWNINDNHHLAVRYNHTLNNVWNCPSSTSMDGGTRSSYGRNSQYCLPFANAMYAMQNKVNSFSLDFNSRLSDKLSNQLLFTISKLDDVRDSDSDEFPFIDILDGDGQNYMCLGYELFTWNNAVHNTIWNIKDNVTYYLGAHKLTAGLTFEHQMADNMYMRNGSGYYRYSSMEDFLSGAAPEVVCLTYGYDGEDDPAARVTFNRAGLYLQDEWQLNEQLNLSAGIRFDGLFFDNSDLMTNKAIYDLDYDGRHIDTGKWPDARVSVSPRLAAVWDVLGDKSLTLRGGTGLFEGRLPLVFFTNMPTNSGMVQYQAQLNASNGAKLGYTMDAFAGGLVTDANGKATVAALKEKLLSLKNAAGEAIFPYTISPEDGTVPSAIAAVDPDFKMPQVWKTSLAVDYRLPFEMPVTVTAEGIFNKTINDACISDWSIPNVGGFARFNGVDNRPIYPSGYRTNTKAFVLENTSKGYGWQASMQINAKPAEWIDLMAAYTHTAKKEVTSMPGSNAESAFTYIPTAEGPNNIKLHNAYNLTPDRFIVSATINDKSNNHFSFIYETYRGGYNYSYMTVNDMNGDGYNYDALYIPTDKEVADGLFRFVSDDDRDRFMDYVHKDDYLSEHQGEYAEGYSVYNPFVHRVDFSYKHDFVFKIGNTKHKLQVGADIKNVLNMFNSSWGVSKVMNTDYATDAAARILQYEGVDADGYATFSTPTSVSGDTKIWNRNHAVGQCWYMPIGAKYIFN